MRQPLSILFTSLFLFAFTFLHAQDEGRDLIIRVDGVEINAYIKNVTLESISYQISEGGPVYQILKSEVWKIRWSDGREEIIDQTNGGGEKKRNAVGLNPIPILLEPAFAHLEYERLVSDKLSLGIQFHYFSEESEEEVTPADASISKEVLSSDRQDLSFSLFGRYYLMDNPDDLKGLYLGAQLGVSLVDITEKRVQSSTPNITTDAEGSGIALLGGLQAGFKFPFLDVLYAEPTVSFGAKYNLVPIDYTRYEWTTQNAPPSNPADLLTTQEDFNELQLFVFPGLVVGLRF